MKKSMRRLVTVIITAVWLAACANPGPGPAPTLLPSSAGTIASGPQVAASPYPATGFNNVMLYHDPALGGPVRAQSFPASPFTDVPGGGGAPAHILYTFTAGPLPDIANPRTPQLRIFPLDGLVNLSPSTAQIVNDLKALLSDRPATITKPLPVFPMLVGNQLIRSQVRYLDFASGSGVRFITQYSDPRLPITNDAAFYTFQGQTKDGRYYITLYWPISTDALPATFDDSAAAKNPDGFATGYTQYAADTLAALDALEPSAFTPDLTRLDNLVQSIRVSP